jgi:glycolate oxidase FAD binding subunit
MNDLSLTLQENIIDAYENNRSLQIMGGNSKAFYGRTPSGEKLEVSGNAGIINYEPTELVITARGGTPLHEIESALAANNQMLPFEPPHFGESATLGGTIACNLSGSRRPYAGSARDFVLGIKLLNGKGEILSFGGEVMKNVAGYDISRLMCGALGSMGILLEVSLKVLPKTESEITLIKELDEQTAIDAIAQHSRTSLPISAALYDGARLYLRLCGTPYSVATAKQKMGGDELSENDNFWHKINEHKHPFFDSTLPLWRLSLAPYTAPLDLKGKWMLDWSGAQRWLLSDESADKIRSAAKQAGGHACLFKNGDRTQDVFHPLHPKMMELHRNLKNAFDPKGIFNPGRMYKDF